MLPWYLLLFIAPSMVVFCLFSSFCKVHKDLCLRLADAVLVVQLRVSLANLILAALAKESVNVYHID